MVDHLEAGSPPLPDLTPTADGQARLGEVAGAPADQTLPFRSGRPWRSVPTSRGRMVGLATLAVGAAAVTTVSP